MGLHARLANSHHAREGPGIVRSATTTAGGPTAASATGHPSAAFTTSKGRTASAASRRSRPRAARPRSACWIARSDPRLVGCGAEAAGLAQLGQRHELHARPALGLAGALLGVVDRLPALPGDGVGRALASQAAIASASGSAGAPSVPASASSTIRATVSAASFLLVPITPDGPRLIQPTAYSPRRAAPSSSQRGRPRCGSARGARRTGRRRAARRGSRSSAARGRTR